MARINRSQITKAMLSLKAHHWSLTLQYYRKELFWLLVIVALCGAGMIWVANRPNPCSYPYTDTLCVRPPPPPPGKFPNQVRL